MRIALQAAGAAAGGTRAALVMLAALGMAGAAAPLQAAPGTWAALAAAAAPGQSQPRPSKAHVALNSAIELYRRGEYEQAAVLFQQAQEGWTDLSPSEQQELARWVRTNKAARDARLEGSQQLAQAEEAIKVGRRTEAAELLKKVLTNQYLSAADKLRAQQLAQQAPAAAAAPPGPGGPALSLARTKLQQARAMLEQGNFDAAEQLANEAQALNAVYVYGEDTPPKVLEDTFKARTDAKGLLRAARLALQRGDLDRAEQLARASAQADSAWNIHIWGDSPKQVLQDVQAARAKNGGRPSRPADSAGTGSPRGSDTAPWASGERPSVLHSMHDMFSTSSKSGSTPQDVGPDGPPPGSPPAPAPLPGSSHDRPAAVPGPQASNPATAQARVLLRQARQALDQGNVEEAARLAGQAQALAPDLGWWEETPEKVQGDVQVARQKHQAVAAAAQAATPQKVTAEEAAALLREGRALFKDGQYDKAEQLARRARQAPASPWGWGLFQDSPDKLLQDVEEARVQHDQQDSARALAEARRLYDQGDLDNAAREAYRAQKLHHGTYSIWDLGDRPQTLLAEIETQRSKRRQHAEASALHAGRDAADDAPPSPGGQPRGAGFQPAMPSGTVQAAFNTPAAPPAGTDPVNQRARQLLAEARQLQKQGRLIEARQKALEAQGMRAAFGPSEDSPELALIQLSSLCYKQIDALMQQAGDYQQLAAADPANFQLAADRVLQARQLAATFGFDTEPMDARMGALTQQRNAALAAGPGALGAPPGGGYPGQPAADVRMTSGQTPDGGGPGLALLAQARESLRAGKSQEARRIAEEVYNGPYGLRDQAEAVLRSVDAEEFGQQRLAAVRTYEAGMSAFRRRDFAQAAAIFRTLNVRLLEEDKQAHLKNIFALPEMQPSQVALAGGQEPADPTAGTAHAGDQPLSPPAGGPKEAQGPGSRPGAPAELHTVGPAEQDILKITQAMQDVKFQQLRQEGLEVQREAAERFRTGDTDRALEILQQYEAKLSTVQLDGDRVALLRRPVESRLLTFKTLKAQRDWEKQSLDQHNDKLASHTQKEKVQQNKDQRVAELMEQYNSFYREGKYKEAEMYAMAAAELDPDNAAAHAGMQIAKIQRRQVESQRIKDRKEERVLEDLNEAEDPGAYVDPKVGVEYDRERTLRNIHDRKSLADPIVTPHKSEKTLDTERQLSKDVSLSFANETPLEQVLDDLRTWHGLNIVPDKAALDAEGISLKRPVSIKLDHVSLKTALDLVLKQAHLTYVIRDNVIEVTTEANSKGRQVTATYQVADLVIPIDDYPIPEGRQTLNQIERAGAPHGIPGTGGSVYPYNGNLSLPNGTPAAGSPGGSQWSPGGSPSSPNTKGSWVKGKAPTAEEALINLITNTVAPQSWREMGGHGTIEYFGLAMALVINQTPDIQEQIADLLAALRRLQDQEVAVEVRLITVAEGFYERIGLDFNIDIQNNHTNARFGPQLVTGNFQPTGFLNTFEPNNFVSGITPAGALTSDLSIPLPVTSFGMAVPPFGGFPQMPGADGGISLGLAFLSDIQVFMFMEAAQGDQRTNVMQAPKLTLSNGQTSAITITDEQFFVTNVVVVQQGGQLAFVPTNANFATGVMMVLNAAITADRRFVRISFSGVTLSNLASAIVPLFPIVTPIIPILEGGFQGNPVLFTQFLQQPVINTVMITTTVTIPDGGTVVLGGLKRMSEGRNEFGPPVLSKIPYINRLFKNVGYGREVESILIMVTPRIIINEEEEARQTGVVTGGPGGVGAGAIGPGGLTGPAAVTPP